MYAHCIKVEPSDIDHMGHVNNAVYLRWVQDAVTRYWKPSHPPKPLPGTFGSPSGTRFHTAVPRSSKTGSSPK